MKRLYKLIELLEFVLSSFRTTICFPFIDISSVVSFTSINIPTNIDSTVLIVAKIVPSEFHVAHVDKFAC